MRKWILKFPRHVTRLMGQRKIVVENVLLHVKPISGPKSLSFTINLFVYFLAFSSLFFTPIWMMSLIIFALKARSEAFDRVKLIRYNYYLYIDLRR